MKYYILTILIFVWIGYLTETIGACENFPCSASDCLDTGGPTTFTLGYELTANGTVVEPAGFNIDSWAVSTQGKLGTAKITEVFNDGSISWTYQATAGKCGVDCFAFQGTAIPGEDFDVFDFCFQVTVQPPPL